MIGKVAFQCPDCSRLHREDEGTTIYPLNLFPKPVCDICPSHKSLVRVLVFTENELKDLVFDFQDFRYSSNEAEPQVPCLFQLFVDFWRQEAEKFVAKRFLEKGKGEVK